MGTEGKAARAGESPSVGQSEGRRAAAPGWRSSSCQVPTLPCAGKREGGPIYRLLLPVRAWEVRPKGCFWLEQRAQLENSV